MILLKLSAALTALCLSDLTRASGVCYFPNGQVSDDVPCTLGEGESMCCSSRAACAASGLCREFDTATNFTSARKYIRATCTDSTWSSNTCPQYCASMPSYNGTRISLLAMNISQTDIHIRQCDNEAIGPTAEFCCGYTDKKAHCCNKPNDRFVLASVPSPLDPILSQTVASTSTSSSSSASSAVTPSSSSPLPPHPAALTSTTSSSTSTTATSTSTTSTSTTSTSTTSTSTTSTSATSPSSTTASSSTVQSTKSSKTKPSKTRTTTSNIASSESSTTPTPSTSPPSTEPSTLTLADSPGDSETAFNALSTTGIQRPTGSFTALADLNPTPSTNTVSGTGSSSSSGWGNDGESAHKSNRLGTGTVVGIGLGASVAGAGLVTIMVYLFARRRLYKKQQKRWQEQMRALGDGAQSPDRGSAQMAVTMSADGKPAMVMLMRQPTFEIPPTSSHIDAAETSTIASSEYSQGDTKRVSVPPMARAGKTATWLRRNSIYEMP